MWFCRLDHDPPARFPVPQQWREILHCIPSKDVLKAAPESSKGNKTVKGRKLATLEVFSETAAAMTLGSTLAPSETVEWHGKYIPIASLTDPPPRLVRVVLWEIYEVGWHYELCALDQALLPQIWAEHRWEHISFLHAIFLGSSGLVLWSEPLPSTTGDLRLTDSFPDNSRILHSFCLLLSAWPNTHPSFANIPFSVEQSAQLKTYEIMSHACEFYVQTFFDHFGHPPLLPHCFPLEYHE